MERKYLGSFGKGAEVEEQTKAQRIVEGITLVGGGDEVGEIQAKNIVLESQTHGKELAIALGFVFGVVARPYGELLVVPVFHPKGVHQFAQFFGKSADRKSTRLNSSHLVISYAVFCLKKKNKNTKLIYHLQTPRYTHRGL